MKPSSAKNFSLLAAWALAFGCAVGSDAFVMPWEVFLPRTGLVGSVAGLLLGGLVMAVIAWNCSYMLRRSPGPGGVYVYASETFGHDHGFLCGYFLGFAYMAIVWLDATAFMAVARYVLGGVLDFGFHYMVEGNAVYMGGILFSVVAVAIAAAICMRNRLAVRMQTAMAVVFALGIFACFAAACFGGAAGEQQGGVSWAQSGGGGFVGFLGILVIAPWLFVGIETVSNISGEFRFPLEKSFKVMVAALATSVVAYLLVTMLPVMSSGAGAAPAGDALDLELFAFGAAASPLGVAGRVVVGITLVAGIFTNLVGNTIAASRLIGAMADDEALPRWLGAKNADGVPRNAVLFIVAMAVLVVPFGQPVLGIVIEVAILGAAIAYGYVSASAFVTARTEGDRRTQAMGLAGAVASGAIILAFLTSVSLFDFAEIVTASYFILVAWGISGMALFIWVLRHDRLRRFGKSPVVWTSLFATIIFLSFTWIHHTTNETTRRAYDNIVGTHTAHCVDADYDWQGIVRSNLDVVSSSIFRDNLAQGGILVLALALMLCLYGTLRLRERDILKEKSDAKSYFFSTVSHDIRTPLNAIIGFSELLKAGFKTDAERDQAMNAIIVSSKTLLGLINDVLDLSKLESGKMEVRPEPTDCASLMRDVTEAFRVSSNKPSVDIRCSLGRMPLLMLDPQRIRQIVFNLFGNAVKFTEKGFVALRASFAQTPDSNMGTFKIEVEDSGCGISDEDLERIGSAYVQVGSSLSRNGGTGLGLAICKQLCAAMGGRLDVQSEVGKGSKFSVVVPNVKIAPAEAAVEKKEEVTKAVDPAPFSVRRILLVDDSRMNMLVLTAQLKHLGEFELEMATDGNAALKMLESPDTKPFDLVLTDMWMPNLDGEGLAKAIRGNKALSSMRVVVVTADVEFQAKFEEIGFDGILLKPVTADKLRAILTI